MNDVDPSELNEPDFRQDVPYLLAEQIEPQMPKYIVDYGDVMPYPRVARDSPEAMKRFHRACRETVQRANNPDFWQPILEAAANFRPDEPPLNDADEVDFTDAAMLGLERVVKPQGRASAKRTG